MDDRFMNELRRDPDPGFTRSLRAKLHEHAPAPGLRTLRPAPVLAIACVAAAVISLFVFPEARVSAQAMLDLFRVRKFAAVQFDPSRLDRLKQLESERVLMVFDTHEKLVEPGPPQIVANLDEAAASAGFTARRAGFLPRGLTADTVLVEGPSAGRMSVSEDKLRALLEALDLRDVSVPTGLDGKVVELRKPASIIQRYHGTGKWKAALVQSKSPEMSVPAGLDIPRLAEIGLRVIGLDAGEARRVAQNTDWRTTLLVPIPLTASTFRQITVHGQPGLMITMTGKNEEGRERRDGSVVLWAEGDQVFGLLGTIPTDEMLQMAESVQ